MLLFTRTVSAHIMQVQTMLRNFLTHCTLQTESVRWLSLPEQVTATWLHDNALKHAMALVVRHGPS